MNEFLSGKPGTVGAMLRWRVEQSPGSEAFRYPDVSGSPATAAAGTAQPDPAGSAEPWVSLDWRATLELVEVLGAGLLSLGLEYEQRVAIASNTRIEWVLADFANNLVGGATTTVYPNTGPDDFNYIVGHCDAVILLAETAEQAAKLAPDTHVHHVVLLDGEGDGDRVISWAQLQERGRAMLAQHPHAVDQAAARVTPDTLATLIYTSGTTGRPKGVELLHSSWAYEGWATRSIDIIEADALHYLWLPLSHVFGKALLACQLAIGFATAVDGRIDRIVPGLGATSPDLMCGAPRIFEKVRSAVLLSSPQNGVKGRIARWAFAVGRASREYRLAGKPLPPAMGLAYRIADHLVFSKLKARMGGNIKFFISGSAKLSSQVQAWFYSAGLLVLEGYGLTETSAVSSVNHPRTPRFGTVGPALPGTEIRIADDGEVLIKGPGVMRGYHKDPERTAEVLVDGWFHTGDIGKLDADGYLTITDRKKDLMKTSGGKYVAPAKVEGVIAATIPYVSQVVAVGDGRKYISALLTMDRDNLAKWAARHGLDGLTYTELTQTPELRTTIDRFMTSANAKLERWETVKQYAILPTEFSVDDGGVTPNMKIRRAAVTERFADMVEGLYADESHE
jgi:long-chain acyl-CoA synthetase